MSGRFLRGLGAKLRPARFTSLPVDTARLDDLALAVADASELCSGSSEYAYFELAPQGGEILRPAFLLGEGGREIFPEEPNIVPPARLYRFRGPTSIFGKGLFLRDRTLVTLDALKFFELGRLDYPIHRLSVLTDRDGTIVKIPERQRRIDEPCLYLAQGGEGVWGHWLVDILPRLIFGMRLPVRTRIVLDADRAPWAIPLLRRSGIDESRIIWHDKFRETLVVPDLYVPSFLRLGHVFSPFAKDAWWIGQAPRPRNELRLYLSRARLKSGPFLLNAPEIEDYAQRRGYEILHPETLDVVRQIAAFSAGTHVVGETGSAMHSTVFSSPGTRVGVLQSTGFPFFVQAGIGSLLDQPTGFAFGRAPLGERAFTLPLETFRDVLDQLDEPRGSADA